MPSDPRKVQLGKMRDDADHLEALAYDATKRGKVAEAGLLLDKAQDLRIKEMRLSRKIDDIQVESAEWKALINGLKDITDAINKALDDLNQIIEVIKVATQIAALADNVIKNLPKVATVL